MEEDVPSDEGKESRSINSLTITLVNYDPILCEWMSIKSEGWSEKEKSSFQSERVNHFWR